MGRVTDLLIWRQPDVSLEKKCVLRKEVNKAVVDKYDRIA